MSIFTSSRSKTENFSSAVTRVWTIYETISVLNWKRTERIPPAALFSTDSAICRRLAPKSNCRGSRLRLDARVENESKNCFWKRPPVWKIKRTLAPPPHERSFYHRRLLGDFVSFQRNRSGTDIDRSGPVASSRKVESARGGAARPIAKNTGAFARHSFAGHKLGGHSGASSSAQHPL